MMVTTLRSAVELRTTTAPPDTRRRDTAWLVATGLLFYALNVDFMLRGDAAMYADYVQQSKFDELTLHIGYYAILAAAQNTIGDLLGIPIHETMAWLGVVAGAATLGLVYRLALHLLGARRDALVCAILFALCGRVILNATTSEVYMVQSCLVAAAFLLFIEERPTLAGATAGAAMLVSPLSAFAFLFFPAWELQRPGGVRWTAFLRFSGILLAVYLPYLLVFSSELFWGHRGLLSVDADVPPDAAAMLGNLPRFQFKHYTVLLLLLLPAVTVLRSHSRLLVLTLAVALPHLYIASKLTAEDNVFLLNTDLFFACWLAVGWRRLEQLHRGAALIPPLLLASHLELYIASGQLLRFETHRAYAAGMRSVAERYLVGRDATMIGDWDTVMVLTFFGRREITGTIEREPLFRQMYDIGAVQEMDPRLLDAPELYLLDAWAPGPLNRFLRSPGAIRAQYRQHSVLARAERLGLDCSSLEPAPHPLYRCVRRSGTGSRS